MESIDFPVTMEKLGRFSNTSSLLRNDHLSFFSDISADADISHYQGVFDFYLLNKPEVIKYVLKRSNSTFDKSSLLYRRLAAITGNGLITSYGPLWEKQRAKIQPFFNRSSTLNFNQSVFFSMDSLIDEWRSKMHHGVLSLDFSEQACWLTLDSLGRALFSGDLSDAWQTIRQGASVFTDFMDQLPLPFIGNPRFPRLLHWRLKQSLNKFHSLVDELIQRRRSNPDKYDDFLRFMVEGMAHDDGLINIALLRDEVVTMILAGHETTSHALTWTLYHLLKNHEARSRLIEELEFTNLNIAHLNELPYTQACIKEAMRLHPPAWIINRAASQDIKLGEHLIKKDSLLVICPYKLHREEKYWCDAEAYQPERFLGSVEHKRFSYIPFGGGAHICVGNSVAMNQLTYMLAGLMKNFDISLDPSFRYGCKASVTLGPAHGLPVNIRCR